jgi:formylglycine-generating enzyme required for sulfatase activity
MPHAFISYVRANRDIIDRLYQELTAQGITVWLDRNESYYKYMNLRVLRGGSWFLDPVNLRVARRVDDGPAYRNDFVGFRVVRPRFLNEFTNL